MAVLPSKTLERYDLVSRIAVGGMAEVFRAVAYGAHGFEKTLAIKRILPELARDPEFEARFIAEAKLAVNLSHANIVQVLDFGRFGGSLFIAMEFVDGLDLAALLKHLKDHGQMVPIPASFQIAIEIVRGLDYAHQHNVVHRDVSPSNVLLSRAGEVKIADFGIAMAAAREKAPRPSGRRRVMGKWRYMSPEQTAGEDLTTRSDVFSAASVLFELFTGDKLFTGDEADQIIHNIHDMVIPKASERRPGLPPRLDELLGRCLERDPTRRPGKPGEIVRALTEISYESSIVATALDVAELTRSALEEMTGEHALRASSSGGIAAPASGAGIDELIRRQLGGAGAAAAPVTEGRKTAVADAPVDGSANTEQADVQVSASAGTHTATVVKKGVDADGITLWELEAEDEFDDTIAAVPSAIKGGKATGSVRALGPADVPEPEARPAAATEAPPSRGWLLPLLLLLAVAGGAVYFLVFRDRGGGAAKRPPLAAVIPDAGTGTRPVAGPSDAGVAVAPEKTLLLIDSQPQGARVTVDNQLLAAPTPTEIEVAPGVPHSIVIEKEGFAPWKLGDIVVNAGQRPRFNPELTALSPKRGSIKITSDPPGAQIKLGTRIIGETPRQIDDLEPGRYDITLTKKDFQPARGPVRLEAGKTATFDRKLEPAVKEGTVFIGMPPSSWANVYLNGREVGTVPRQTIRLPIGHHRLRLHNPQTGKETTIEVDVVEGKRTDYKVKDW